MNDTLLSFLVIGAFAIVALTLIAFGIPQPIKKTSGQQEQQQQQSLQQNEQQAHLHIDMKYKNNNSTGSNAATTTIKFL